MSDFSQGPGWWQASDGKWYPPEQAPGAAVAAPPMSDPYAMPGMGGAVAPVWGGAPAYGTATSAGGPIGKVRGPWAILGLSIITLGVYGIYWECKSFGEMKRYNDNGISGGLALLLAIITLGIPLIFMLPAQIGELYSGEGQQPPVTGVTGFWVFLPYAGSFVWLWKCAGHLNNFWTAHGYVKS